MNADNLTAKQRADLLAVFSKFADRVERVDVYGSRARGDHRPGSDVDLIVAGEVDFRTVLSIAVALEESWLSINADVQRYADKLSPAFAANVARDAKTLFTRDELLAARIAQAA